MMLIYNENLTKDIVQNYFKTYEDIDGELTIITGSKKISSVGVCVGWYNVPTISFILRGSMEIEGEMQPVEIVLREHEIENAFTTMVEATGRKVKRVSLDFDEHGFKNVSVEAVTKRKIK